MNEGMLVDELAGKFDAPHEIIVEDVT